MDAAGKSLSMDAESSKPLTTIASDSSSESKTFTSFSLGSGRRCPAEGFPACGMRPPILEPACSQGFPSFGDSTLTLMLVLLLMPHFRGRVALLRPEVANLRRHLRVVAFPRQ